MPTAFYWLKIAYFFYLCLIRRPRSLFPLEFRGEVNYEETRVMVFLSGDSCMIVTATVFDWSTGVTDRRADRR